jgi:acyl-[acyl-carrier-protein]-phospholipid O-acyltransferase/long-chain-fatty-acid--[acyl-carrier-protein] ligase
VIPFLLFAALAGSLADRLSKRSIIYFTRITEILTTSLGVAAFFYHSIYGVYAVLFLMATQAALFSPCKYGIIPEIVPEQKISHCNGVITATTYLAIIVGTFLASFLTDITRQNFVVAGFACVLVALLGFLSCLGIEKTKAQASRKKVSIGFVFDIVKTLQKARKQRYLLTTLIFGAYFLFMGSYTQLNIIPFTLQSLHLSEVQGGYLFLMTAIGIGLGSYAAGQLSGKEVELGFIPLAAFGIGLCFLGLFFFSSSFFVIAPLLIFLGIFGGFYIVPVDAFIQIASPDKDRGQNVATSNFLSFVGVIIASGLLAFLGNGLELSAAQGFFVVGIATFAVGFILHILYADQVIRLLAYIWAKLFLNIRIKGKGRIPQKRPVVLVAPRASWLDTLILMSILPRRIHYIVPMRKKRKKWPYRLLRLIPIEKSNFFPLGTKMLEAIKNELESGNSVCLMQPIQESSRTLQEWENHLENLLRSIRRPIVPIHISEHQTTKRGRIRQFLSLRENVIQVSYGALREFE